MAAAAATPLPWGTNAKVSSIPNIIGGDTFSDRIAINLTPANAAFITHCVNMHGELVEALDWLIKQRFLVQETDNAKFAECLAALTKANNITS